jgi:glycine dehydrogenase
MLDAIGCESLESLVEETVPASIRLQRPLKIAPPRSEHELLIELKAMAEKNLIHRSMIGMGYCDCITPPVIQRNILENPGWYTQYTPYQAEIAQGRLEALLNFQTMVSDLTGLPLANASLLDEATAGAEAMHMCRAICENAELDGFFVAEDCHPQTIAVVKTRAKPLGIKVQVGRSDAIDFTKKKLFGVLLQYPAADGRISDYTSLIETAHAAGAMVVVATDLLDLALLRPPGEMGADIAVGSSQGFGVPMGFGGPHAAFMATRDEYRRQMPGRIIGVSKDAQGRLAYRLAIQTREQHIRREKATSNICTAQVLLAIMAGMYAVYHGPAGLRKIAERTHAMARLLAAGLRRLRHPVAHESFFDTLTVPTRGDASRIVKSAAQRGINLCPSRDGRSAFSVSTDETTTTDDVAAVLASIVDAFPDLGPVPRIDDLVRETDLRFASPMARTTAYLTHPVFNSYHSETEMLRYIFRLQSRDLSLAHSMIPLGSCTMKLNATSEMLPVTWAEFSRIHPFAPPEQTEGYSELFRQLEAWLAEITGFAAVSLQPNAGSQGEYAGLLAIRAYHESRGEPQRDVCLIPTSAHGTNPASAVVAGFRVVPVACDEQGNIDLKDLEARATEHASRLGALMVTYPSTHGVFEEGIRRVCEIVHLRGGQVYMDGANMNAQVGVCRPADMGADVCHLNLHKTFCIPHGGGGPGMGPIGVAKQLVPFLPGHPLVAENGRVGPVAAAPYGSSSILPISWVYIAMMGGEGLRRATQVAILNANYMARRLSAEYDVLYSGRHGRVGHEFILDVRRLEKSAGVKVEDFAKRLMDYGFHAPTISFPVPGTLMIEPTESESKAELDRFCDAMLLIREEIRDIEAGRLDRSDNPLKGAPHSADVVARDDWSHPYSRERAAFPAEWVRERKFWPFVSRIDNVWGDRNLMCTCPPMSDFNGTSN